LGESRSNFVSLNPLRGWLLDLYPSAPGEMTVWFLTEKGERVRFIDKFQPKIYVSGNIADLSKLSDKLKKKQSCG
jgi:hypothetical protein